MVKLHLSEIDSPLGKMQVVSDDFRICLLLFSDYKKLPRILSNLSKKYSVSYSGNYVIKNLKSQLSEYFAGKRRAFDLPINIEKFTDFQKKVWTNLQKIQYGHRISYMDLAKNCGNQNSYRACANANSANPISIIIPCHRVVRANGELGGYAGGIERKRFLLNLESKADI